CPLLCPQEPIEINASASTVVEWGMFSVSAVPVKMTVVRNLLGDRTTVTAHLDVFPMLLLATQIRKFQAMGEYFRTKDSGHQVRGQEHLFHVLESVTGA